jgi:Protein of unknown function (DUF1236)
LAGSQSRPFLLRALVPDAGKNKHLGTTRAPRNMSHVISLFARAMQTCEERGMTNRFLVSVAAIALIAGAGGANAQGGMNREGGGAATQQSTPSGGSSTGGATTQKEPSSGMKSGQSEMQKSPGETKGQRAEEPGMKSKSQSTENEPKGTTKEGSTKGMKAEGREGQDKNMKAESREGQDKNMKAEGREGHDKNMKAEGREKNEKNLNAQGQGQEKNLNAQGRESTSTQTTTTGQAGAGAKLSTEQRTKISTVIRSEHVEPVTNVDFAISVGTRVPRERVHLRALPSEVITIHPDWRGYEFFLVRDQIVVVDPRTGEIVDVLPA